MFKDLHYLTVEVAADGFLGPGLVVELSPAFLFRVTSHICHHLGGSMGSEFPRTSPARVACPSFPPHVLVLLSVLPEPSLHLEVSALRAEQVLDVAFWVSGET